MTNVMLIDYQQEVFFIFHVDFVGTTYHHTVFGTVVVYLNR